MDEPVTTGVETPVQGAPTTDNATVGQVVASQATAGTQAPETTTTEEVTEAGKADPRDWQGYARNLERENKSLKEFKQLYREQTPVKPAAVARETNQASAGTEEEAIALLKSTVESALDAKLAPIFEEQVLNEFSTKPYVKALGPEIQAELAKLDPGLPLGQRLDTARAFAIANNIDTFNQVEREQGKAEAYGNQGLKTGQTSGPVSPNQATVPADNLLDRVMSGQIDNREYKERKSEIDQLIKEHTFDNPGVAS